MYKKYLVIIYSLLAVVLIGFYIMNNYGAVKVHESVHKQIDLYFGCKNVSVEVTWFNGGSTTCHDDNRTFSEAEETMHSFNEVISYNNDVLSDTIYVGVFIIFSMCFIIAYFFMAKWEDDTIPPPPPFLKPTKI